MQSRFVGAESCGLWAESNVCGLQVFQNLINLFALLLEYGKENSYQYPAANRKKTRKHHDWFQITGDCDDSNNRTDAKKYAACHSKNACCGKFHSLILLFVCLFFCLNFQILYHEEFIVVAKGFHALNVNWHLLPYLVILLLKTLDIRANRYL